MSDEGPAPAWAVKPRRLLRQVRVNGKWPTPEPTGEMISFDDFVSRYYGHTLAESGKVTRSRNMIVEPYLWEYIAQTAEDTNMWICVPDDEVHPEDWVTS